MGLEAAMRIKTWKERCEEHPDHDGIVSHGMIQQRMQEEIDDLRAALDQPVLAPAPGYCKHCKQYTIEEPLPAQPVQCESCKRGLKAGVCYCKQPEQKPVAYIHETGFLVRNPGANLTAGTKLYAAPISRKPLTEEEIAYAVREISFPSITAIARAIEAAHGIKE